MNNCRKNDYPLKRSDLWVRCLLLLLLGVILVTMAVHLPTELCPDEGMRSAIPYWIYNHNDLPTGYEAELLDIPYGFSYASMPLLPALASALLMKLCSLFSSSDSAVFLACRMTSVLSIMGCMTVCFLIGDRIFKKRRSTYLLAIFVCFIPQVLFVGSYCNSDSVVLFGSFLTLYYLICATQSRWSFRDCCGLSIALSVVILSYYSAYGWIAISVVYCIFRCLKDSPEEKRMAFFLKRLALVTGLTFLFCGWFFVRNAVLYNGDLLGISARSMFTAYRESQGYAISALNSPEAKGLSPLAMLNDNWWLYLTIESIFGVLGNMDIFIPEIALAFYKIVTATGMVIGIPYALIKGKNKFLTVCLLLTVLTPFCLSFIYSYTVDYQPQGRYVISCLPAVGVFVVFGYHAVEEWILWLCSWIRSKQKLTDSHECRPPVRLQPLLCLLLLLASGYAFTDTVRGKLFFNPRQEVIYNLQDDKVQLELDYYTLQEYASVHTAVWHDADQNDLVWWLGTSSPSGDSWRSTKWRILVDLRRYSVPGEYLVHTYGQTAAGEETHLYSDTFTITVDN